ncbi:MAG TPA: hypothetical protein VFD84_14150 [Candidatus Binatia bacterium]|nr:hypothetical protein [Candidatus Binatia bacterium]
MSAARLAAQCLDLLGPVDGPVTVVAPRAPRLAAALVAGGAAAADTAAPAAAVVVLLDVPADPAARRAVLAAVGDRLPPGAPLLVVDHNQPRRAWRRVVAAMALLLRGVPPARARYPTARELAALGFGVERLRLGPGERVQLVLCRVRTGRTTVSSDAPADR